ncbi:protein-export chaperone SecB [Leeia sp. TBRC 13508]|uniref:Protein-export protein SecB n=1 Tax=Leeia speluncae TaxID=2884804 RepID=A0ABS8D5T0_9NEIS|nr:protein-export chaperone SecB [Leeia speluncae]MCB6183531.1 protein-export chaperone SecB [Leeia speluncae]
MSEQQAADNTPVFNIEKLYVKDLSLEVPHAPQIFLENGENEVSMQLHNEGEQIGDGFFEVTLTVTVTNKIEDKTVFLAEAAQAGIFQIRNVPEEDMGAIIGIACPTILFPYVREVISDLVNRAGFPPVILTPVNFEALYAQRLEAMATEGNA